jgi:hypothetical protein
MAYGFVHLFIYGGSILCSLSRTQGIGWIRCSQSAEGVFKQLTTYTGVCYSTAEPSSFYVLGSE